jgi:hypothetical protein
MKVHKIHYGREGKFIEQEYLEPHELKPGGLYKIVARNAKHGIWCPDQGGFWISRYKFRDNFLFVELHWDLSDGFGTVRPLEFIEMSPFDPKDFDTRERPSQVREDALEYLNTFSNPEKGREQWDPMEHGRAKAALD